MIDYPRYPDSPWLKRNHEDAISNALEQAIVNKTTYSKISLVADRLWQIHEDKEKYKFLIPLLDEPYQLALQIMESDFDKDPKRVAAEVGCNWQTVVQVRRALE